MIYKKSLIVLAIFISIVLSACENMTTPEETITNNSADTLAANYPSHEEVGDYVWNEADEIPIILNGNSITADNPGLSINGTTLTITSEGTYRLTGTLNNGQIIVNSDVGSLIRIILNGVNISNSSSAPIYIKSSNKTIIVLADNTDNILEDASTYVFEDPSNEEPNAALFSKSNLTIYGSGALNVIGNYNDGISSKDGLIIRNANITVTSVDDGIRGKDYLIVIDGTITVNADGDGFKSDNDEDATRGYIQIESGNINVTSESDGIAAETDAIINSGTINITSGGGSNHTVSGTESAKGIKGNVQVNINGGVITLNSADDGLHSNNYVSFNNGTISISTGDDGIHADAAIKIANGEVNIIKSFEGMEAPKITIKDGNISIIASDDGFNATYGNGGEQNDGSCLYLNGGNVYVNTTRGDGIDSNGNVIMTGGTVVINGPTSNPEVGADVNGSFNVSGGLLIYTGPNSGQMIETPSSSSDQYSVKVTSNSYFQASSLFHVQDATGNNVITFEPVRSCYYIVFSTPALTNGSTYNIYTGGSSTGINNNGLYTGGTYSGGTLRKTFSISGKITSVSF